MSGWPTEWFDEIDSTNEEARRRVNAGDFSNCWIAAKLQSSGRGRLGREWKSPIGNLYTTVLFRLDGNISDATKIPFVSGLAVVDAVEAIAPDSAIKLKWPNDVRSAGSKLSGILVEAGSLAEGCWVACGIGINVSFVPEDAGQDAICVADLCGNGAITPEIVLDELRVTFDKRLHQFSSGFENTRRDWLKYAEGLEETISIRAGDMSYSGTFEDLGPHGEILLRLPNGSLHPITAGDVELIKERVI